MKLIVIGLWVAWAIWGGWISHTDKPAIGLYMSGLVLAGVTCYTFNLM